jgi:hypothetical protein
MYARTGVTQQGGLARGHFTATDNQAAALADVHENRQKIHAGYPISLGN